jgi:protein-disulfide isomerase
VRPRFLIAAALVVYGLIVAGLVGCGGSATPTTAGAAPTPGASKLAGIPQDGLALGKPDAPRTLAVYADIQCPFCRDWDQNELPAIVADQVRTGKVRVVFRGLAFVGPESDLGLRAVLAAGRQDRLWNLVNVLYANQGTENGGWLTEDSLRRFAGAVPGLDVEQMLSDLHSPEVDQQIGEAQAAAVGAGVNSTPSFQVGPTGGTLVVVSAQDLHKALTG